MNISLLLIFTREIIDIVWLGDIDQLVEHWTSMLLKQVRFPNVARDFSLRVNFQCRHSYGVRTPLCPITCIYICALVKDPVVHGRVLWIIETLQHLLCTVGWAAQLCRSWLSLGKATWISYGRNPIGTILLYKVKVKLKKRKEPLTLPFFQTLLKQDLSNIAWL